MSSTTPPLPKPKATGTVEIRIHGVHLKDGADCRYQHTITEEDFRRMSFFDFTDMVLRRVNEGIAGLNKLRPVMIDRVEGVETNG